MGQVCGCSRPRSIQKWDVVPWVILSHLASPSGGVGLLSPGPLRLSFWTNHGDLPYLGPGLAHLLFSLPFTWNQVEWPPGISQVTAGFHNMETWRTCFVVQGDPPGPPSPEDWGQL